MVEVFIAASLSEAHLLRTLLEDHGIRAEVRNEILSQVRGEVPMDASTAPAVWIFDEQRADEARAIIAEHRTAPSGPDWTCAACGEANGPAFELCWKCGAPRRPPDAAPRRPQ